MAEADKKRVQILSPKLKRVVNYSIIRASAHCTISDKVWEKIAVVVLVTQEIWELITDEAEKNTT